MRGVVTPGRRVRVLAELYDPDLSDAEAIKLVDGIAALLAEHYPAMELITYIESNPPADELPTL
ncbi:hypothetical protein [Nonomuraea typhae]|uniref:Uncharacterized protein n=1 Tax=Nonomuraea typhae TaxID=2603600 RepID=A0ABW7YLU9_9ACTN